MSPGLWVSLHVERIKPERERTGMHLPAVKAEKETRLTLIWVTRIAVCVNPDWIWLNPLFSFYCVFKRKSSTNSKTTLKQPALQQNTSPPTQDVNQSRLCPGFTAEHGTKRVILNQPCRQPATDASSGMPNKKPNSVPGLRSLHPALPQTEGQMVPVTQKNSKRLPSHSNNLCPSPGNSLSSVQMVFFKDVRVNLVLVGKHDTALSGATSLFANWGKIILFCSFTSVLLHVRRQGLGK